MAQTFDARNRLITVSGANATTNIYDALNNRVGQLQGTNTITWVINPNTQLSQALVRVKNGVTTYYVYGPGLLYQVTEGGTTNTLTYHYDYRGSTIALSDDNGNVTDRMEYSLYATLTHRVGTSDTPFLFNGRYGVQTDANGLLYLRARYYNPYLCRFINADPLGFGGGLNWYAYGNGNPVSLVDPFGLDAGALENALDKIGAFADGVSIGVANTVSGLASGGLFAATHGEETIDAAFSAAFHPVRTFVAVGAGVENTFADFGTGFGSGNYECAGKAFFGIVTMGASALKLAKLGEAANLLRTAEAAENGGIRLSQKGLDLVGNHLSQFEEFGGNSGMMQRLQDAFAAGQKVTGADANFYLHEASEATMMGRGLGYDAAHSAALGKYGVTEFNLYHPEVIQANSTLFNNAWRAAAGLPPKP